MARPSRLLNLDLLKPGDVLLSMTKSADSRLIAFFTNHSYSHAALVVDSGTIFESTILFDKDGGTIGGVVVTPLTHHFLLMQPGTEPGAVRFQDVMQIGPEYTLFDVYRHREHESKKFKEFVSTLQERSMLQWLRPYAHYRRLAEVATGWRRKLLRVVTPFLVVVTPRSHEAGLFCSEFLARVFADGGFPVSVKAASVASPGDLAMGPLVRVTDELVVDPLDPNLEKEDALLLDTLRESAEVMRASQIAALGLKEIDARFTRDWQHLSKGGFVPAKWLRNLFDRIRRMVGRWLERS